jgi:hypothetical protein
LRAVRLSYARDTGIRFLENRTGRFGLSLEAGAGYLEAGEGADVFAFQALPMISYGLSF